MQINVLEFPECVIDRSTTSYIKCTPREFKGCSRKVFEFRKHLSELLFKMSNRHYMVAQTQLSRLNSINHFTREYQLTRSFFTDNKRKKHCGNGRENAELDFRLTESRALGRDNYVARTN